MEEVVLASPLRTRLIADAQIKTDKVDVAALVTLLRGNLVARAHLPDRGTRLRKQESRQRLYWARLRTRIRNRIYALLARQHDLELPQCADLFGQRGLGFLRRLQLKSAVDQKLLEEDLDLLGLLAVQIRGQEERIKKTNALDADTVLIQSLPGMGPILAAVAAAEINGIERFPTSARLCA
jgi:transposase